MKRKQSRILSIKTLRSYQWVCLQQEMACCCGSIQYHLYHGILVEMVSVQECSEDVSVMLEVVSESDAKNIDGNVVRFKHRTRQNSHSYIFSYELTKLIQFYNHNRTNGCGARLLTQEARYQCQSRHRRSNSSCGPSCNVLLVGKVAKWRITLGVWLTHQTLIQWGNLLQGLCLTLLEQVGLLSLTFLVEVHFLIKNINLLRNLGRTGHLTKL